MYSVILYIAYNTNVYVIHMCNRHLNNNNTNNAE